MKDFKEIKDKVAEFIAYWTLQPDSKEKTDTFNKAENALKEYTDAIKKLKK